MFFVPKLYNFSLSKEFADSAVAWNLNSYKVERPSFAVLLDHTLAVVWHVFNLKGAELSVLNKADIAWALRFLEAIDVSQLSNTDDFDKLAEYLRKTLITRYSMEDEQTFAAANKTMCEQIDDEYPTSSALEDFLNSAQVREDMELSKSMRISTTVTPKCNDVDLLQRLKELNPTIRTLDDVRRMGNSDS